MTLIAREAIQMAAEGLGGVERLIAWAKESAINERIFWSSNSVNPTVRRITEGSNGQ